MKIMDAKSLEELIYSRRLPDGRRIEVRSVAGEVVARVYSANGRLSASHICGSGGAAIEAVLHWDGTGYPFAS
jgi:hypothetical protein